MFRAAEGDGGRPCQSMSSCVRAARRTLSGRLTVAERMHVPPQTTRARLRGECIRRLLVSGTEYRVDWSCLKVLGAEEPTLTIQWRDPLQAHDEDTEDLIEKLTRST